LTVSRPQKWDQSVGWSRRRNPDTLLRERPTVTLDFPIRPLIGALIRVYPRLIRAVLQCRFRLLDGRLGGGYRFPVVLHLCFGSPKGGPRPLRPRDMAWSRWLAEVALPLNSSSARQRLVRARSRVDRCPCDAGNARLQNGPRPVGARARDSEIRRCIVVCRLKRSRIDLIEHLAGLNFRAFIEQPVLNDEFTCGRISATK